MARERFECPECGVEFFKYRSQAPGRFTYCSRKCIGTSKRHGSTLFCAWCDSPFYRRFGEQDLGERVNQFCSRECYGDHRVAGRTSYPKEGAKHKHRIVAESVLGRALTPSEVVHHIDEDRQNYQPSNLAVFPSQSFHARCHFGEMADDELRGFHLEETAARERSGL